MPILNELLSKLQRDERGAFDGGTLGIALLIVLLVLVVLIAVGKLGN